TSHKPQCHWQSAPRTARLPRPHALCPVPGKLSDMTPRKERRREFFPTRDSAAGDQKILKVYYSGLLLLFPSTSFCRVASNPTGAGRKAPLPASVCSSVPARRTPKQPRKRGGREAWNVEGRTSPCTPRISHKPQS